MDRLTCDRCGGPLLVGEPVRYEARIQVYAAYDPLELTPDDLAGDHRAHMRALLAQMADMDPEELEDGVYKEWRFDLCMACQRRVLLDPLPRGPAPADNR